MSRFGTDGIRDLAGKGALAPRQILALGRVLGGAMLVRVHDVKAMARVVRVAGALRGGARAAGPAWVPGAAEAAIEAC